MVPNLKKIINPGILLVSISALLWGTSFVGVRWGLEYNIDPIIFVAARFFIAALIFTPIAIKKVSNIKKLLIEPIIILLGLFNALGFGFQFVGQQFTTAGKASLFVNFYVLLVPLVAPLFLKEKLSGKVIFAAVLGFFGAFMVSTNLDLSQLSFDKGTIKGDIITLGSGIAWAMYIILSKWYLDKNKEKSGITVFYGTIIWTSIFLIVAVPFEILVVNMTRMEIVKQFSWQSILAILYLAVICTALAFAIYMEGLKRAEAGESSIFMLLEVVVAFLLEWMLFGTKPELFGAVGVVIIIVAVLVLSIKKPNRTLDAIDEM